MDDREIDIKINNLITAGLGNMEKVHNNECPLSKLFLYDYDLHEFYKHHPKGVNTCKCPTTDYIMRTYKQKYIDIKDKKQKESFRHLFLTLSLDPTKPFQFYYENFDPHKIKLSNYYIWCFEFFGKDLQYHPHIHLLFRTNKKLDRKRIINKLSKMLEIKSNFIDYEFSTSKLLYNKREEYIKGIKTDKKEEQIKKDNEFRDNYELLSFYELYL